MCELVYIIYHNIRFNYLTKRILTLIKGCTDSIYQLPINCLTSRTLLNISEHVMSQQWHSSTGIASNGVNARYRMELL